MTYLIATLTPSLFLILAEGTGGGAGGGGGGGGGGGQSGGASGGGGMGTMWIGLMLALVVFWIITMRGNSRDKKQRQAMRDNLGKNDRVLTIGGVLGSVVAVKGDHVIVKVDETSNTKMTFTRSAIQQVLTDDDEDAAK